MIKRMKEYFETRKQYEEAKKTLTLMLLNQYGDFLETETKEKEAELKAYEAMTVFSETFKPEDLHGMIASVNKIAGSPELQTSYYEKVHNDAQKEKMKVVK